MPQSIEVLVIAALVAGFSLWLGRIACQQGAAAFALGFCLLAAASNTGLWLVYARPISPWALPALAVAGSIAMAIAVRLLPWRTEEEEPQWPHPFMLPLFLTLLIVLTIHQQPVAMTNFFQPWDALWISRSLAVGRFFNPAATSLGDGFMTSAMYYTWNLLGLTACISVLKIFAPFAVFLAVDVVAKLASVAVLASLFRKSSFASTCFAAMLLLLIAFDPNSRRLIALHAHDEGLLLASSIAFYALVKEGDVERRLLLAMLSCCFFAIARNYGAVFGGALICVLLPMYVRVFHGRRGRFPWLPIVVGAVLFLSTVSRDVVLLIAHASAYFPRTQVVAAQITPFGDALRGIGSDLGVIQQWHSGLITPSPKGIWIVAAVAFFWNEYNKDSGELRNDDMAMRYIIPILFVAAPAALSLVTGYRAYATIDKLYASATPFFIAMPVVWFTALLWGQREGQRFKSLDWPGLLGFGTTALLLAVLAIFIAAPMFPSVSVFDKLGRSVSPDRNMAELLKQEYSGKGLASLVAHPILYFHYEPGIGIRYYLGGNLFTDYDFWSSCVLAVLGRTHSLSALLEELGGPNLYVSNPNWRIYARLNGFKVSPALISEVTSLDRADYVRRVFRTADGGRFYQLRSSYFPRKPVACRPK